MHIKKISIMAIATLMGVTMLSNKSFAHDRMNEDINEILKEKIQEQKKKGDTEGTTEGVMEDILKRMDQSKILVIPEDEKERMKLAVNEDEEFTGEVSSRATLRKPKFPTLITDRDSVVAGMASENAKVMVTLSYQGEKTSFKLEADSEGLFGIELHKGSLFEGMEISAYEYSGSKKSAVAKTTVVRGASNAPQIIGVTNYCDTIIGMTDGIHDTAYAEINGKVYECGSVDNSGMFKINIPRQKVGTHVSVYTITPQGVKSPAANTIVQPGYTIEIDGKLSTNTKTITGKTRPYTDVYVTTPGGEYMDSADKNGKFKINLENKLKRGKSVRIEGRDHNVLINSEVVIKKIYTAPAVPKVSNKKISKDTTSISGTSKAGYTAYVKIGDKYYKSTVGKDGKFTVKIPKQKKGTKVYVYVKGTNGVNSNKVSFVTAASSTAPDQPTLTTAIATTTTVVKGKGQKGATATIRIGNKYYRSTVDKNGNFSIKIPAQKKGTVVKIYLKNKKGEYSVIVSKKVLPAPRKPWNVYSYLEELDGKDVLYVMGSAPEDTVVYIKVGNKMYKDESPVGSEEIFSIPIHEVKYGTKVKLCAKDVKTGAMSKVVTYKIGH